MDGSGQNTESSEMAELFSNNGPTQFVRLAEPDDDRNAQQPAQHRHYFGHGNNTGLFCTNSSEMMQDTSGEMVQDNSTIVSQRSLANTVDTDDKTMRSYANTVDTDDKTLQIGSISHKPRPDDPGTKPPIHKHTDTETALNNNSNSNSKGIALEAGCLSFPSPPLMQEEEAKLPHRSNGSGEFPPVQGKFSSDDDHDDDNKDDDQHHSGDWDLAHDDAATQHGGSKRRSLMIAMIAGGIIIVIIVIVTVHMATSTKDKPKKKSQSNGSVMIPSGESSVTTPPQLQTVAPTFDEYADDEEVLQFASSSINQTGSNDIFDLETTFVPSTMLSSDGGDDFGDDELGGEDSDISVPITEASAAPSMLRRAAQVPTGLL